jgi:Reverse transcriptase (RNA-dependent DNA polymerase)
VFIASLEASKAFNGVNHLKLFSVLLKRGLPPSFVELIANWYRKLSVVVRFYSFNSAMLRILSGVRQSGVFSPSLFNMYDDSVICQLRKNLFRLSFNSFSQLLYGVYNVH